MFAIHMDIFGLCPIIAGPHRIRIIQLFGKGPSFLNGVLFHSRHWLEHLQETIGDLSVRRGKSNNHGFRLGLFRTNQAIACGQLPYLTSRWSIVCLDCSWLFSNQFPDLSWGPATSYEAGRSHWRFFTERIDQDPTRNFGWPVHHQMSMRRCRYVPAHRQYDTFTSTVFYDITYKYTRM